MHDLMQPYSSSLIGLFVLAVLMLIQFGVADLAFIRAKHIPGMPVTAGHGSFFFRATRAYANTYESIGLFLLLTLICILSGADAVWTSRCIWLFTAARAAHMACYYADVRLLRSVVFGIGAIAELGLLVAAGCVLF